MLALLVGLGQLQLRTRRVERRERGHQIVLRLHHFTRLHRHQRVPRLHRVAELRDDARHPPGEGREHRRRRILVDRDVAVGDLLAAERVGLDRHDLQPRPLLLGRPEGAWRRRGLRLGAARVVAAEEVFEGRGAGREGTDRDGEGDQRGQLHAAREARHAAARLRRRQQRLGTHARLPACNQRGAPCGCGCPPARAWRAAARHRSRWCSPRRACRSPRCSG